MKLFDRRLLQRGRLIRAFLICAGLFATILTQGCSSAKSSGAEDDSFVMDSIPVDFDRSHPLDFTEFPIHKAVEVSFEPSSLDGADVTYRERLDQARDWLLLTILSNIGLTEQELDYFTFDLIPNRNAIWEGLANHQYGRWRSAYIGQRSVLAMVPDSSQAFMDDAIAHILDHHRKNLGEIPDSVVVFTYRLSGHPCSGWVKRIGALAALTYYSESKGYIEGEITHAAQLADFLASTDDLTHANIKSGKITFGGRKLQARSCRNISLEDVAAIWQAAIPTGSGKRQTYQANALSAQDKIEGLQRKAGDVQSLRGDLSHQFQNNDLQHRSKESIPSEDLGFSLDPHYDYPGLVAFFQANRKALEQFYTQAHLDAVQDSLLNLNEVPFLQLIAGLQSQSAGPFRVQADSIQYFVEKKLKYQKARYDGNLQGTQVGMHLFYTDLLAKIWTSNYLGTAPLTAIPGFTTDGSTELGNIYESDGAEVSERRLWFGPKNDGYQIGSSREELLFGRNATQIYSKSSFPLESGDEVPTTAFWAAAIQWWNNHYEEVGEFEPEYEALNAIIKWSIAIAWMNETGYSDAIHGLDSVPVARHHCFWDWARKNSSLRFTDWDSFGTQCSGYLGSETETMDILFADYQNQNTAGKLWGGVSLSNRAAIRNSSSIQKGLGPTYRKSGMNYAKSNKSRLVTHQENSYFFGRVKGQRVTRFTPSKQTPMRHRSYEFRSQPVDRAVTCRPKRTEFRMRNKGADLEQVTISKENGKLSIKANRRGTDDTHQLAKGLENAKNPEAYLANSPGAKGCKRLSKHGEYLVEMEDHFLHVKIRGKATGKSLDKWDLRTSNGGKNGKMVEIKFMSKQDGMRRYAQSRNPVTSRQNGGGHGIRNNLGGEADARSRLREMLQNKDYHAAQNSIRQSLKGKQLNASQAKALDDYVQFHKSLLREEHLTLGNLTSAEKQKLILAAIERNMPASNAFHRHWSVYHPNSWSTFRTPGMQNVRLVDISFPTAIQNISKGKAIVVIRDHAALNGLMQSGKLSKDIVRMASNEPQFRLKEIPYDAQASISLGLVLPSTLEDLDWNVPNTLEWELLPAPKSGPQHSTKRSLHPSQDNSKTRTPVYYLYMEDSPC
jgi:hypothetical protein